MSRSDEKDKHHPVLQPKRGGSRKEDIAIRKALLACAARLMSDLEAEIGRLAALHDDAKAEILRLEALRDAAGQALQAARTAHGDLRGASAIWGWLPDSLEKGNAALQACRQVSSGSTHASAHATPPME